MKYLYIIFFMYFMTFNRAYAQSVTVKSIKTVYNKDRKYLSQEVSNTSLGQIQNALQTQAWHLFEHWFQNPSDYETFLAPLIYGTSEPVSLRLSVAGNNSLLARIKPFVFYKSRGNEFILRNKQEVSEATLTFELNSSNRFISRAVVSVRSNARVGVSTAGLDLNYVLLPDKATQEPEYYNSYLEVFRKNKTPNPAENSEVPFKQIDFDPLEIELRVCKKFLGIDFCKETVHEYKYGKVLSGKDIPGNEQEFKNHYFGEVTDVTAYNNQFSASFVTKGYVQTAVIVDKVKRQLTFFRESLEPWQYGFGDGDYRFVSPTAVTVVGNNLYVLDRGDLNHEPIIVVLHLNHEASGAYAVSLIGTIKAVNANTTFINPKDIGGFVGATSNYLAMATESGVHLIGLDNSGLASGITKSIKSVTDPYNDKIQIGLNDVLRLDATEESEHLVMVTLSNRIISCSINQFFAATGNSLNFSFYTYLEVPYYPSNLAYMKTEQKWYVTDLNGKIHTLTKEGRYIGGGGSVGSNEGNGDLLLPNAITPNTILDPTNDFRYRFIVANKWDYETGFKLFAPTLCIPEFKVFENLNNGNLTFTFSTSGKWQQMEKATGMSFSYIKINGTSVSQNQISSQDSLVAYPNILDFPIAQIQSQLRRGWNKVEIGIGISKQNGTTEMITREVDFYWLPTTFTPEDVNNEQYIFNKSSAIGADNIDYIYKPITIGNKGALVVKSSKVKVSEYGSIHFAKGSTFYNQSDTELPLSNISFKDTSKFYIHSQAYLCVNRATTNPKKYYEMPNLEESIGSIKDIC